MHAGSRTVGLLLFDDVDLLDLGGPYEVFLTASRLARRDGDEPPFTVVTLGLGGAPVTAYGGLGLTPERALEDVGQLDVLVVPGAVELADVRANAALSVAIADVAVNTSLVASVCTGAFLLADQGMLDGRLWTTHWEDIDLLAAIAPGPPADGAPAWVDAGPVVTAGGLSSGIAMALHLVDRLAGRELAVRTARQIDYEWDPDAGVSAG